MSTHPTTPEPGSATPHPATATHPMTLCAGRVAVVTGAGRGIGRAHALALAAAGASVVVNDLGAGLDGTGGSGGPAQAVVEEIRAAGGHAVADTEDVSSWSGAAALIEHAVAEFGRLDVLVNNAGILRDRMLVNLDETEWDDVLRVHLKGHVAPLRHAARHWRERAKATGAVDARVINTSSGAGLAGSVGQGAYSAAKAGIVGLTLVAAAELARYGVTVNAIAPAARTRMTEKTFAETMSPPGSAATAGFDPWAPANISPLVVWLACAGSREVTGRVFELAGGRVSVADGWRDGAVAERDGRWDPAELGVVVPELLAKLAPPVPVYGS